MQHVHIETFGVGPDVVLFPGLPQPPDDLRGLGRALAERGRVHIVHRPGYGLASAPADYDGRSDAAVAEALAGLERAAFVGCSFGFRQAASMVLGGVGPAPRVLVGLGPMPDPDDDARALFRRAAALVREGHDLGPMHAGRMLSPGFAAAHPEQVARVEAHLRCAPPAVIAAELEVAAGCTPLIPRIAAAPCPVHFVVGALDVATPEAAVRALASAAAGALTVVPGAGHLLHVEALEATLAAVRRAIEETP